MKSNMLFVILSAASLVACNATKTDSQTKFDSSTSVLLVGTIENGTIVTRAQRVRDIVAEVKNQLQLTVGIFNGVDSGINVTNFGVYLTDNGTDMGEGFKRFTYKTKIHVSWNRDNGLPQSFNLVLPARGDKEGLNEYYKIFGKSCSDGDSGQGAFFYHYRPNAYECPLDDASKDNPRRVARFDMTFKESSKNTEKKSPEYHKIWEDGRMEALLVFGKYEAGASPEHDLSGAEYRDTLKELQRKYGRPTERTTDKTRNSMSEVLVYETRHGKVKVNIYLIDELKSMDNEFIKKYNSDTKTADLVIYAGHSGLGSNIRALSAMGEFVPGHYQIFMADGCSSFSYLDHSLRKRHRQVNPTAPATKYFDVIVNAMPAGADTSSETSIAIIESLVEQKRTYKEILKEIDPYQKASVIGEEDNMWPRPF